MGDAADDAYDMAELDGLAYRYATLDANIKLLEGP